MQQKVIIAVWRYEFILIHSLQNHNPDLEITLKNKDDVDAKGKYIIKPITATNNCQEIQKTQNKDTKTYNVILSP